MTTTRANAGIQRQRFLATSTIVARLIAVEKRHLHHQRVNAPVRPAAPAEAPPEERPDDEPENEQARSQAARPWLKTIAVGMRLPRASRLRVFASRNHLQKPPHYLPNAPDTWRSRSIA